MDLVWASEPISPEDSEEPLFLQGDHTPHRLHGATLGAISPMCLFRHSLRRLCPRASCLGVCKYVSKCSNAVDRSPVGLVAMYSEGS